MKKIVLVLLVLSLCLINAFGQSKRLEKLNNQLENLYKSDAFLMSDLIISPEIYNPNKDATITRIDFLQDTTQNFNEVYRIYASINQRDGLDEKYTVGSIYNYQTGLFEITVIMKVYYANGNSKTSTYKTHFDDLQPPSEDIQSAEYSIDIDFIGELNDGVVLL